MPKLKINRVVSFSSEDTTYVAANILTSDPSKKWKCATKGEKSANIIIQLEEASLISSVDMGNEHSAYVEVLVKRSGGSDDFKVLLVMSSFMSPLESRQSTNGNKVRMFGYNELQSPERDEKWDVIKIVCTQPFNRHVQYGLSFITLHTPGNVDGNALITAKLPQTFETNDTNTVGSAVKLGKFALRPISPNNLVTGTLFARRNTLDTDPPSAAAAIRNLSTSLDTSYKSPKLKISTKQTTSNQQDISLGTPTSSTRRNRDELLYSKDEEDAHEKIDNLIQKRKKELEEKQAIETSQQKHKRKNTINEKKTATPMPSTSPAVKRKHEYPSLTSPKKNKIQKLSKPFNQLLGGVTIVISGIENPERSTIRNNALEMGAKYKADWDHSCTHLVCAFTNTPKFNQVKGKGKIVNRLWISDCYAQRKRLPWRRYALDRKDQDKNESEDEICEDLPKSPDVKVLYSRSDDEFDTEEEIDTPTQHTKVNNSYSADTDEEIVKPLQNSDVPELSSVLLHKKLYIDDQLCEDEKKLLIRYIFALNGTVLDSPTEVDFIITTSKNVDFLKEVCPTADAVSADWVWDCYNKNKLIPVDEFIF